MLKRLLITAMIAFLAGVFAPDPAAAAEAGQFTELQGEVTVIKTTGQSIAARVGTRVQPREIVTTGRRSKATILLNDGSVLRLGPMSNMEIRSVAYDPQRRAAQSSHRVNQGTVMFMVGANFRVPGSSFEVSTPTAVAGVRGTIGIIRVGLDPDTGQITTLALALENDVWVQGETSGSFNLTPGMFSTIGPDGVAQDPLPMSEEDILLLLESVTLEANSLNERAGGLRNQGTNQAPPGGVDAYVPPELIIPPGEGNGDDDYTDPNDLGNNNPEDLIFVEPPLFTELIIIVPEGEEAIVAP